MAAFADGAAQRALLAALGAPEGRLVDAYCGIGTFSLPLAAAGWRVHGVEANPEVLREHIEGEYFAPTPEWDDERSWDRLWS